jgi:prephenate dehydratase
MKVAYQGLPGAFSHDACLSLLPDHRPLAAPSFAAVLQAVIDGRAERGVLPLENVAAGPVPGVRSLIERSAVRRIGEHLLPIRMHLLGLPGASLARLTSVASHPMALRQCARTLARLNLRTQEAANTAIAAADLAEQDQAVLASAAAARFYGLEILLSDVHDDPENATLFAVLGPAE